MVTYLNERRFGEEKLRGTRIRGQNQPWPNIENPTSPLGLGGLDGLSTTIPIPSGRDLSLPLPPPRGLGRWFFRWVEWWARTLYLRTLKFEDFVIGGLSKRMGAILSTRFALDGRDFKTKWSRPTCSSERNLLETGVVAGCTPHTLSCLPTRL